ncbi:MAG: hypothetical protein ACRDTJ_25285 [Pseudonocardiaceae bacterium]
MSDVTGKQASGESGQADDGNWHGGFHPAWCSAEHCFVTEDDGVRVHVQAPTRWEDGTAEVRVETRLIDPADDPGAYVELSVQNLRFKTSQYYGILPVTAVRRLRDQLTAHLDAAKASRRPPPAAG